MILIYTTCVDQTTINFSWLWLFSFGVAELFLLLARRQELLTIFKKRDQRTEPEKKEVAHGLSRSVLLDALIFVPVSVLLMLVFVKPWLGAVFPEESVRVYGVYGAFAFPSVPMMMRHLAW